MLINQSKFYLLTILALLVTIVVVASCDNSNTAQKKVKEGKSITVATISNGEVLPEVRDSELKRLAAKAYNRIPNKATRQASFFEDVSIQGSGSNYYLVAKGKDLNGNCESVATELTLNSEILTGTKGPSNSSTAFLSAPTTQSGDTHSCSGVGCSSCSFTYSGGAISGCNCDDGRPGAYCNHTVTNDDQQ